MRRHDWASRMFGVIDEHIHAPFVLASGGCSLFVARCVDAMTDSTFEAQVVATYADEREVLRLMATPGAVREVISGFLGEPAEGRPMRGDVVLFEGGEGAAVGIWDGRHIVAMGEGGLRRVDRSEIRAFWAVR